MKNVMVILLILLFTGCNSQEKKEVKSKEEKEIVKQPKGQWDVHKEYDELGNLIEYDSIYRYSYSNIEGDSIRVNLDSVMDSFQRYFGENTPLKLNDNFSHFSNSDSLLMKDFFKDDYFLKNWDKQYFERKEMIKKMDSIRNGYLRQFYPGLLESMKMD